MLNIKGTKTEKNLQTALEGEALARVKYEIFASQAKKDGYVQLSEIFKETSDNEKEHAKIWFKLLNDGGVKHTPDNLEEAISSEEYEWSDMYNKFAAEAKEEGFYDIAKLFELTATIEREHERRYKIFINNIRENRVFKSSEEIIWKCGNCGHFHYGKEAPEVCPMCNHPKSYFRKLNVFYG